MAEAQLRDQYGNPVPLTDQHGNPVILTDEHGNPVHVTGIATTTAPAATAGSGFGTYGGTGVTTAPPAATAGSGFGTYGGTGATTAPLAATTGSGFGTYGGTGATTAPPATTAGSGFGTYGGAGATTGTTTVGDLLANQPRDDSRELRRSSSSSSSSSEDDGQGGRRKKKGLNKIKEKIPGMKNKEQHSPLTTTTAATGVSYPTRPTATNPNPNHPEHHKKGIMEKIKEKLPGHHNH